MKRIALTILTVAALAMGVGCKGKDQAAEEMTDPAAKPVEAVEAPAAQPAAVPAVEAQPAAQPAGEVAAEPTEAAGAEAAGAEAAGAAPQGETAPAAQ
jgi:hypothetical protein